MQLAADFLRQIHPVFLCNGFVSEQAFSVSVQAFTPSTKDEGQLSTYDGVKFTAKSSFEHYTKNLKSAGVLGITRDECTLENLPFTYDLEPFDGHCSIDFRRKSKAERKLSANNLRDFAQKRGWLYQP